MRSCLMLVLAIPMLGLRAQTPAPNSFAVSPTIFTTAPRGPHATGTREQLWVDSLRGEPFTKDPTDRRHVMVQIWYPATITGTPQSARYVQRVEEFSRTMQANVRQWQDLATNSVLNAPLTKTPARLPVPVYHH